MSQLDDCSVDLIVTSPPYPMIEMWDSIWGDGVDVNADPSNAFELIHKQLDLVWDECMRVLKDGGFMCINIGDATRTFNGTFSLWPNTSRIISHCVEIGFTVLPKIIWRKTTNSPNKFMGSGMLPCGAYVTLEHESILIFRKGGKRQHKTPEEKAKRMQSAYFWEERNLWFSDLWQIPGVKQAIFASPTRDRNASFPLEIPYRLINMFSEYGDTVLDPFLGLGTTSAAAIVAGRNSVGYEVDKNLKDILIERLFNNTNIDEINQFTEKRLQKHLNFIEARETDGKPVRQFNKTLNCKVMTMQEVRMTLPVLKQISIESQDDDVIITQHIDLLEEPHIV